jgi:hypothetical protein
MTLADRITQCGTPIAAEDSSGCATLLNGAAEFAGLVSKCPIRYVLSDDLTRVCTELAYSRGASNLACADLLHVPAELLWVEWCYKPWRECLDRYGFRGTPDRTPGRRGTLVRASKDGRRGVVRTFWSDTELGALASSIEGYFDFDTAPGDKPGEPNTPGGPSIKVYDNAYKPENDVLGRCFRFRFEGSWWDYYERAHLSAAELDAVRRHALGTIAIDIPVLLTFLLLLASRAGLPRNAHDLTRLNRSRLKSHRAPLLDYIEVRAPLLPEYLGYPRLEHGSTRRAPRLHHVRGHLMRSGNRVVWRVPHLRGTARAGMIRARTVTWTFDKAGRN